MSAVFLACFLAGLVLGVYVMLHGVEREAPPSPGERPPHEASGAHDPTTEPSVLLNRQNVAALVGTFGAAGYLLQRFTTLDRKSVV